MTARSSALSCSMRALQRLLKQTIARRLLRSENGDCGVDTIVGKGSHWQTRVLRIDLH